MHRWILSIARIIEVLLMTGVITRCCYYSKVIFTVLYVCRISIDCANRRLWLFRSTSNNDSSRFSIKHRAQVKRTQFRFFGYVFLEVSKRSVTKEKHTFCQAAMKVQPDAVPFSGYRLEWESCLESDLCSLFSKTRQKCLHGNLSRKWVSLNDQESLKTETTDFSSNLVSVLLRSLIEYAIVKWLIAFDSETSHMARFES